MLPACCVGLKRIWPEVAVTGDGWNVCKTFPPGERRSGAGPVEQGETEETARFLVFFLLVGDSLEEEPISRAGLGGVLRLELLLEPRECRGEPSRLESCNTKKVSPALLSYWMNLLNLTV